MLKWLTDENVPRQIIRLLRQRGFDTADIREMGLAGAEDSVVMDTARRDNRVLVTTDRDFSNIILYPPETHRGIVVLRMGKPTGSGYAALFTGFLGSFDLSSLDRSLTIVSENKVRQRKQTV